MRFLSSVLFFVATALFVVAIPLAIISTNVQALALDPSFYEKGQVKFGAMQTIGLQFEQVQASSRSLASYFGSVQADLASELQKQGLPSTFFNDREITHLKDVKDIIVRIGIVQQLTLVYAALFLVGNLVFRRKGLIRRLARSFLGGAALTLAAFAVFGALFLMDFSDVFLAFHLISFSNDLWILDPRTDYLIRMFPQQFFFEASLTLAIYSAMQALGLAVVGTGLFALNRPRVR